MPPSLIALGAAALTLAGGTLVTDARGVAAYPATAHSATAHSATAHSATRHWRLDPSFGQGGIVATDFPGSGHRYAWGYASVVQPDGRPVVAGVASTGSADDVAVARYRPNGTLDPSFGTGGRVTIGPHALFRPSAMALQDVGGQQKILIAVAATYVDPYRYRCSVIRLNSDGTLDTHSDADPGIAFGHEGIKVVKFPGNSGFCGGIAVDPNNRIVVSVQAGSNGGDVGVFRLLPRNGALDPGFGGDGLVTLAAPGYQSPGPVVVQPGLAGAARVVVGGLAARPHGYDWALWRLRSDGRLDPTFGHGGRTTTAMYDARVAQSFESVQGLTLTSTGGIVAAGSYRSWPPGELSPEDTAAVAEYTPDGLLVRSFGDGGRAHLPYDSRGDSSAEDVTVDSSGHVLYGGYLAMPTSGLLLAGGFDASGALDRRFGDDGSLELVVGGGPYTAAYSVQLDPTGRLVLAGIDGDPSGAADRFGVVRLRLAGDAAVPSR